MMNMVRVAAAGRNWKVSFPSNRLNLHRMMLKVLEKGAGADPYLTSIVSSLHIQGVQSQGVIACAKHLFANEQEHFRGGNGGQPYYTNLDERTLHEVYALPLAASIKAGVGSVMCSYNRIKSAFSHLQAFTRIGSDKYITLAKPMYVGFKE